MTLTEQPLNSSDLFWIPLQHFAAEDEGRTEDPTDRKRRKAREEGRVAKSADLTQATTLLLALLTVALFGKRMVLQLLSMLQYFLSRIGEVSPTDAPTVIDRSIWRAFYSYYFNIIAPIFVITFAAAFITMALQVGFVYAPKAIKIDMKKIAPNFSKYIKKTFLSIEALYNLGKSLFKVILIGIMAYFTIKLSSTKLITAPFGSLLPTAQYVLRQALFMMSVTAIFMLALAIADYFFQKSQMTETLKMTKQEIKDEMKEDNGNPHVKSLMRQKMMEQMRLGMVQNVPKADVIITNPTHFAVALEYTWGAAAPRVTAKGEDLMALRIREIAKANDVPIVENKPLARGLYAMTEIGDEVPEQYLRVIADILGALPKIQAKFRR
jgi:flagellar biosynthetic protein FlhB